MCEQGCAALSVVALRKPNNCQVIMEEGGALAALLAMKTHPDEVNVQVIRGYKKESVPHGHYIGL